MTPFIKPQVHLIQWALPENKPFPQSTKERLSFRAAQSKATHQHLAHTLSKALCTPIEHLNFRTTKHGKPYLYPPPLQTSSSRACLPHFSISHTKQLSAYVIWNHPIGLDIEKCLSRQRSLNDQLIAKILKAFYLSEETKTHIQIFLQSASTEQRALYAIHLWTYLESQTKLNAQRLWHILHKPQTPYPFTHPTPLEYTSTPHTQFKRSPTNHLLCISTHQTNRLRPMHYVHHNNTLCYSG